MINFKITDYVSDDEKLIRTEVFIEEQNFIHEFDDCDKNSFHLVMYENKNPVGCCRFFQSDEIGKFTLGRLAIRKIYRGKHYGKHIVTEAEKISKSKGANIMSLSAQCRVSSFYEKLGYKKLGDIYFDEHCEHIHMEKPL